MEEKIINVTKKEPNTFKKEIKQKITFAKLNKYFLLPFLAPIFCMMSNYCFVKVVYYKVLSLDICILKFLNIVRIFMNKRYLSKFACLSFILSFGSSL